MSSRDRAGWRGVCGPGAVDVVVLEKREVHPVPRAAYVPPRCHRAPNAAFDRAFGIFVCNQRDPRCCHYGPAYVLDEAGRHYECRKREA